MKKWELAVVVSYLLIFSFFSRYMFIKHGSIFFLVIPAVILIILAGFGVRKIFAFMQTRRNFPI